MGRKEMGRGKYIEKLQEIKKDTHKKAQNKVVKRV